MAKPTHAPISQEFDSRLYSDYARLVCLQAQASSFNLLPHLKAGSVLSGRHHSLFRGRGLNFEELRHYQLGDDIRSLDWKATLRTGKPHVRSYTEEKDRNVFICIDQRSSMFFASTQVMKSVVAAEVASICGWRALKEGDRVGLLIASERAILHHKPQRTQNGFLMQLNRLSKANQLLNAYSHDSEKVSFSQWVDDIRRMKLKQSTLIFISDWHGCEEHHLSYLKQIQQHNDILAVMVHDPLECMLPRSLAASRWVVGDGCYQVSLDSKKKIDVASASFEMHAHQRRQSLSQLMIMKSLPYIELDTHGEHIKQFKKRIGG
ncbi:MAG: DUF58 domain-containing protein [Vibrio fluvialis]